jgi:pyridoxal 5'-phosphate synthase pdxS subunit
MRNIKDEMARIAVMPSEELMTIAKEMGAPYDLVKYVRKEKALPVVNFSAGGISTPADAAMIMQLGADGVFVGSGIFKSENPSKMASAIVEATTHFEDPEVLAKVSRGLGNPMSGTAVNDLEDNQKIAGRGW